MKKIGKQLNFIKELEKADELEESLEPKDAKPPVADLNLDPKELASEIEQYLNEESDSSDSPGSDLFPEISNHEIKHSVDEQSEVEKTDKEKDYWAQVYGKTSEKQAEYDRSALEHLAEIKAGLEAKLKKQALEKNRLSEKPVSLIAEETEDFSFGSDLDSDFKSESDFDSTSTSDSDSEYESPYEELMPPSMRKENREAALERQKRAAEEEAREKKSREDDVRIRREQHDGPPKF